MLSVFPGFSFADRDGVLAKYPRHRPQSRLPDHHRHPTDTDPRQGIRTALRPRAATLKWTPDLEPRA